MFTEEPDSFETKEEIRMDKELSRELDQTHKKRDNTSFNKAISILKHYGLDFETYGRQIHIPVDTPVKVKRVISMLQGAMKPLIKQQKPSSVRSLRDMVKNYYVLVLTIRND
jgi:hypothetical protein